MSAEAEAAPPASEQDGEQSDSTHAGQVRIGPIWVSEAGSARVRSGRDPSGSIHVAYRPKTREADAELRAALLDFELRTFPETAAPEPRQTIRTEPPEAWMARLDLPQLPVRWNRRTVEYLHYFKDDPQGQALIRGWLRRMGRYETEVKAILREVGVPEDLVYVAMIESGFKPSARSHVGAAGMWQFMAPTGHVYGLQQDYWTDDRHDHVKATYAAAIYLRDLKARFGSWELALASYNAGYGLVMKSVARNNTNNYWALCEQESGLPYQTTNYVPKIVAAAIVGRNREAFGITDADLHAKPRLLHVPVKVPAGTRLEDLAKAIDVDPDLLDELNAHYVRGRVSPKAGPGEVRIPKDAMSRFETAAPKLRAAQQDYTTYTIRWGEDLEEVAHAFGITEKALRRLNGVADSAEVAGGTVLVVPRKPGDPLAEDELAVLPLAAVPPLDVGAGQRLVFYRVTRAATPRTIEDGLGVPWSKIVAWNDIDPSARLQDALLLQVLVPRSFDAEKRGVRVLERDEVEHVIRGTRAHLEAELARRDLVRRAYKVRKGDTLARIGRKYDLSIGSLARINGFPRAHKPEPGDLVIVYVPDKRKRGTVAAPAPRATTITAEVSEAANLEPYRPEASTADTAGTPGTGGEASEKAEKRRNASTADTAKVPGRR